LPDLLLLCLNQLQLLYIEFLQKHNFINQIKSKRRKKKPTKRFSKKETMKKKKEVLLQQKLGSRWPFLPLLGG
jgi:hypothetical protein